MLPGGIGQTQSAEIVRTSQNRMSQMKRRFIAQRMPSSQRRRATDTVERIPYPMKQSFRVKKDNRPRSRNYSIASVAQMQQRYSGNDNDRRTYRESSVLSKGQQSISYLQNHHPAYQHPVTPYQIPLSVSLPPMSIPPTNISAAAISTEDLNKMIGSTVSSQMSSVTQKLSSTVDQLTHKFNQLASSVEKLEKDLATAQTNMYNCSKNPVSPEINDMQTKFLKEIVNSRTDLVREIQHYRSQISHDLNLLKTDFESHVNEVNYRKNNVREEIVREMAEDVERFRQQMRSIVKDEIRKEFLSEFDHRIMTLVNQDKIKKSLSELEDLKRNFQQEIASTRSEMIREIQQSQVKLSNDFMELQELFERKRKAFISDLK